MKGFHRRVAILEFRIAKGEPRPIFCVCYSRNLEQQPAVSRGPA